MLPEERLERGPLTAPTTAAPTTAAPTTAPPAAAPPAASLQEEARA
jgi:hypothetical protein